MSRTKGANAEREVVSIARDHGLQAQRTAPLQAAQGHTDADVALNVDGFHLEVRRRERVLIDAWCAQTELASGTDVPCVVWRKSRQPWRVALPLADFLDLVRRASL